MAMDRLVAMARSETTVIVCAEENPRRCHRRLLLTPALQERGLEVRHIRGDGRIDTEETLEQTSPQLSLF